MVAILCRDGDEICDLCMLDNSECNMIYDIVDKSVVGDIVVCDGYKSEAMLEKDKV